MKDGQLGGGAERGRCVFAALVCVCVCVGEKGTCAQSSSRARKLECEGVETEGGTLLTRDLEALKCEPQIKFDI